MFTLDQIRCFVAVAEELHFGRAAELLSMTQPPLSRQIQKLERSLGVTLLERDHRTVSLTEAGRAFLVECHELLATAERAPATARKVAAGHEGVLRIGFTAAAGYAVLGPLLASFAEALPHVHLELAEMVSHEQTEALAAGSADLGLARPSFDAEVFDSHLLLAEDLMLAVPQDHPLALRGTAVSEDEVAALPLIMHSPLSARYFYDLAVRLFPIDHHKVVHTVGQITTMIALARAGHGAALVPRSAHELGTHGVSLLPLGERGRGAVELHAIWSRRNTNPALHRAVEHIVSASPAFPAAAAHSSH